MKKKKTILLRILFALLFTLSSIQSNSQEKIIQNGDSWSYFDKGYLEDNWFKKQNYEDWKIGISPLGYGDRLIETKINFGSDE
jgi:hypothetical protein